MVVSPDRRTVRDYLRGPESHQRQELVWGMVVCEPPAPFCTHQGVVTRVVVLLDRHVRESHLGRVYVSPVDVVLDSERALVLQPDVIYVSRERSAIVRKQVWGAPDLVVEVESVGTRRRDRTSKLRWYRQYGAREYWLIDPREQVVTVIDLKATRIRRRRFHGLRRVVSAVLPGFRATAASFFD